MTGDVDEAWQPVLLDLIELDEAGALAGIRAVIAERLRQVRTGWRFSGSVRGFFAEMDLDNQQDLVIGAVLLADMAAEIDRQAAHD